MPTPLQPLHFQPLPLGSIRPAGWLRKQLRLQAEGLSGHLDIFWPDIRDSGWFGGTAEGWERAPYWLDGVIPLAFLLDDAELKGTEYPFRQALRFAIEVEHPVRFPLLLRIPAWASGARLQVDGATVEVQSGCFHRIEREWAGRTDVELALPLQPVAVRRENDAVAVLRGALVYALEIGEDWRRVNADAPYRELPHADWEVHPTTAWNYALEISEETLAEAVSFAEHPVGDCPFSPAGAPASARVRGRRRKAVAR